MNMFPVTGNIKKKTDSRTTKNITDEVLQHATCDWYIYLSTTLKN